MRKLVSYLVVAALTAPLAGCLFVSKPRRHGETVYRPACRPNEYWDGNSCRHKGNKDHDRDHGHDRDHRD